MYTGTIMFQKLDKAFLKYFLYKSYQKISLKIEDFKHNQLLSGS